MTSDNKKAAKRSRRRKLVVALALLTVVTLAAFAATWVWLESRAGQERVRLMLERRVSAALGRPLGIGALEFDLLPLRASLTDITIGAGAGADQPLLRVPGVRMQLDPWALMSREILLESLELDDPTVHWDIPDGEVLPTAPRDDPGFTLNIERLSVSGGAVELNHQRWNVDTVLDALEVNMQPAGRTTSPRRRVGTVRIGGGNVTLENAARESSPLRLLDPLQAELRFAFEGDSLDIEELRVTLANSELTASGEIVDWQGARLDTSGRISVADVANLIGLDGSGAHNGEASLEGTVTVDQNGARFAGNIGADSFTLAGIEATELSAAVAADLDGVNVRDLRARLFGGEIEAHITVDRSVLPTRFAVEYRGTGVNLARLTTTQGLEGLRFAGTGSAAGDLVWSAPWRETITGTGSIVLDVPSAAMDRPPGQDTTPTSLPTLSAGTDERAATRAPTQGGVGQAAPIPSLPLRLRAAAEYELDAGNLLIRSANASLPQTDASLEGSIGLDGGVSATVHIGSSDLRFLDSLFTQVRRFRGELPMPQPLGLGGAGEISAVVSGSLAQPGLDGTLTAQNLSVSGNPVGDVEGNLRLTGTSLEVIALTVTRGDGSAAGEGRFRIGEQVSSTADYSFGLRLDAYPMEVHLPQLGVPLTVAGQTSGELRLSGNYGEPPSGSVEIRGDAVRLNDLGDLTADVRLALETTRWSAERFELLGPRGRLSISGAWQRTDDTVQASLDGFGLDASIVADLLGREVPVSGVLELQARLTGDFATPDAAATIRWTDAVAFGVSIGSVASSAELRAGSLAIAAVGRPDPSSPAVPPPTPTAAGGGQAIAVPRVPTSGWAATLSTDLQAPRLANLQASGESGLILAAMAAQGYEAGADLAVEGRLEVGGRGFLDDWRSWRGSARLSEFTLTRRGLTFSIPDPFTLELDGEILRAQLPRLISEAGTLAAEAVVDLAEGRWIEAQADGSVSLDVLDVLTKETDVGGRIDVSLVATGDLLSGDVDGTFDLYDVSLSRAKWPWSAQGMRGTVRLADGQLRVDGLAGTSEGRPFRVDGVIPLAALAGDTTAQPARLDVSVDDLPLQPLWERAGPVRELLRNGKTSVTFSAQGYGTDWRTYTGNLDVRELDMQFADVPLRMTAPVGFDIAGGRLTLTTPINLRGPGTDVDVDGFFDLGPFRFDATLRGQANVDPLNRVTGNWGVAGRAELDVHVAGDPPDLSYFGTVKLTNGLVNAPILQPVESIDATLTLDDRIVRIDEFVGSLGGGSMRRQGNVAGNGEIQLVDNMPYRLVLNTHVDQAELRLEPGVRVTLTADLLHDGTIESSMLSGTAFVSAGEYTKRWNGDVELLTLTRSGTPGVDHELAATVNLDIDVRAPGDLRISNNMADVEFDADLQVRGTLDAPVLLGRATIIDGSVTLRDHRYRLLHGSVEFQNPLQTETNLDFLAETNIRQYVVTVGVTGSPDRGDVQASFSSSPPLADLQLIELLTIGNAPDETRLPDSETIGAVGTQATSFLTQQYLNQVERGAQRVFGVDRFRVEPAITAGSGDPTARVTLGKQVTPELWVSWTSVLGTTEEQLVTIEYQLSRNVRITATREEDGSFGVDVRFDHRFR